MTEESFQQGRKIMASANSLRGYITKAEAAVGKWTKIEDVHRRELREEQANGAKKCIDKALIRLKSLRDKFSAMKFPDSDIPTDKYATKCKECGRKVPYGTDYCNSCTTEPVYNI